MRPLFVLFLLAVICINSYADETYCELKDSDVKVERQEWGDDDVSLNLHFPKPKEGILYRVQLRYGNIEYLGDHEVFTNLELSEIKEGYDVYINLGKNHEPALLLATYHLGGGVCYSNIYITVIDHEVTKIKNGA